LCGIRERGFKDGEFGLTSEDEVDKKPIFQLPFYNAPRLRATDNNDPPVIRPNAKIEFNTKSGQISEAVAKGIATVHPSAMH
jgi:hypothetical protein